MVSVAFLKSIMQPMKCALLLCLKSPKWRTDLCVCCFPLLKYWFKLMKIWVMTVIESFGYYKPFINCSVQDTSVWSVCTRAYGLQNTEGSLEIWKIKINGWNAFLISYAENSHWLLCFLIVCTWNHFEILSTVDIFLYDALGYMQC